MRMVDLIAKKRDGGCLTEEEIRFLIKGYTEGSIPDYQMSAWAMAVLFRGMTDEETAILTDAMANSGDQVNLSCFGGLSVDKHSTGGVGDKTTLIIAPIVASLGGKMAKMSGRGLGHTGGTVDKLESIPGFQTTLTAEAFRRQVEEVGVAVIGQSGNLTPADKKLYALRDVTATVESIPLIASSVMSKKLAAGARSIVLDVKWGAGAFMKQEADAVKLAETMVRIGKACGRNVAAMVTDMNAPLGSHVGNALEVAEAVEVLRDHKPGRLQELCRQLSANLLSLCHGWSYEEAWRRVEDSLCSGAALRTMERWITAQGGNAAVLQDLSRLPQAPVQVPVKASCSGYICSLDAEKVGISSSLLGAGRMKKDDPIDHAAGIVLEKTVGDYVRVGETLAWLHTSEESRLPDGEAMFLSALQWSGEAPKLEAPSYRLVR